MLFVVNVWVYYVEVILEFGVIFDFFGNVVYIVFIFFFVGEDVFVIGCGLIGFMVIVVVWYVGVWFIIVMDVSVFWLEMVLCMGVD